MDLDPPEPPPLQKPAGATRLRWWQRRADRVLAGSAVVAVGVLTAGLISAGVADGGSAAPVVVPAALGTGSGSPLRSPSVGRGAPHGPVVLFIGDSWTTGASASSRSQRWTSVLSKAEGWQEVNAGSSGAGYVHPGTSGGGGTFADIVGRESGTEHPSLVVVSGGSTDIRAGVTAEQRQAAVTAFFATVARAFPGVPVVVLTPFPPGSAAASASLTDYGTVITKAANAAGDHVVQATALLTDPASQIVPDGQPHAKLPTDAGYAVIAAAVRTQIDGFHLSLPASGGSTSSAGSSPTSSAGSSPTPAPTSS